MIHPIITDWINTVFRERLRDDPAVLDQAKVNLVAAFNAKKPVEEVLRNVVATAVLQIADIDPRQAIPTYSSVELQEQRLHAADQLLVTYFAVHQATCVELDCDASEALISALAHKFGITTKVRVARMVAMLERLNVECPCCSKEKN